MKPDNTEGRLFEPPKPNIGYILHELRNHGAVRISFMPQMVCKLLLTELHTYTFIWKDHEVGPYRVRERMGYVDKLRPSSFFFQLRLIVQKYLESVEQAAHREIFQRPLLLNEVRIHRYPVGDVGITPHRDESRYKNIIAIAMLEGEAQLGTCRDRDKTDLHLIDHCPGDLILLRAPGLFGTEYRPFHFVENIRQRRTVALMCQNNNG